MRYFVIVFLGAVLIAQTPACGGSSKSEDGSVDDGTGGNDYDGPVLAVNPETLDFGTQDTVLTVEVSNAGIGTLEWSTFSGHRWLDVSPQDGTDSGTVTATVDRESEDLWPYENTGHFTIYSNGGDIQVEISVTILAEGDPVLDVVPTGIDFGQDGDTRSITVFNRGGGELTWNVSVDQSWISADPLSGINDELISLTADRSNLSPGMYRANITVTSNAGEMSVPADLLEVNENIEYDLHDFMPMAVGNKWAWWEYKSMVWWSFEIVDEFQKNGVDVWAVEANDSHGGYKAFWFVYSSGTLNVISEEAKLDDLPNLDVSHGCRYWTQECNFPLFDENLTPRGELYDPFWNQNAMYVPGSLSELLDFYGIWGSDISLADFPLGDKPDCIGVTEEYEERRYLYTAFAPGIGPVLWDYWPLVYARIGGVEHGVEPTPYEVGITPIGDEGHETLFYTMNEWQEFTWVQGTYEGGNPVPTHAIMTTDLGDPRGVVFFNRDFIPVQSIFEGVTVSVHNVDAQGSEGGTFDPSDAFHLWMDENGRQEFRANIQPEDFTNMLDYYGWVASENFDHIVQFLADEGITTFDQLVTLAKQSGPDQIRYQAMALGLGAAAAEARYYHLYEGTKGLFEFPLNFAASLLGGWLGDQLCLHCPKPGEPTVAALICQGLDYSVGVVEICHYCFFWPEPSMPCVSSCMASMGCFTNICMPTKLSASAVREAQEENGF